MSRDPKTLTIHHAQKHQPWTVPYSVSFKRAASPTTAGVALLPHLYATHDVLHAMKSLGKLATVFEDLDHSGNKQPTLAQLDIIKAMAADLITAALRLGNLYNFEVADELVKRVREKNSIDMQYWPTAEDAPRLSAACISSMRAAIDPRLLAQGDVFHNPQPGDRCCSEHGTPDVAKRFPPGFEPRKPYGYNGANGMRHGDRIRDVHTGLEGVASDFTQDGDVTITTDSGRYVTTKWNNCVPVKTTTRLPPRRQFYERMAEPSKAQQEAMLEGCPASDPAAPKEPTTTTDDGVKHSIERTSDWLKNGEAAYKVYTEGSGAHPNRFPAWYELEKETQEAWCRKAEENSKYAPGGVHVK